MHIHNKKLRGGKKSRLEIRNRIWMETDGRSGAWDGK